MTEPDQGIIRDFTIHREPKQFRIDDDVFKAPAIISPVALQEISILYAGIGDLATVTNDIERTLVLLGKIFTILLPGPSGARFKERLLSAEEPLDLNGQVIPVLYWLLEQYGMRPTQPSSPSPDGSTDGPTNTPNGGTSSTDGPSPTESTTEDSTPPIG